MTRTTVLIWSGRAEGAEGQGRVAYTEGIATAGPVALAIVWYDRLRLTGSGIGFNLRLIDLDDEFTIF
jgi:hypothetical protein